MPLLETAQLLLIHHPDTKKKGNEMLFLQKKIASS